MMVLLRCFVVVISASLAGLMATNARAQVTTNSPANPGVDLKNFDYRLQARQLADGVFVFEGANDDFAVENGCNIINTGFLVGTSGVVVINTGPSRRYGEQQLAAIRRVTHLPIVAVLNLNLHPDYIFGNQAYPQSQVWATPLTELGIKAEGKAYEDNLYRLCGDWMRDTELQVPLAQLPLGDVELGGRALRLQAYEGHTRSDAVVVDRATQTVFTGGLVFHQRVPTTPHADLPVWQAQLQVLKPQLTAWVVPSHGPVHQGAVGLEQTSDYLRWLDARLKQAAAQGREMVEVLRMPLPERFRSWAALKVEYARNVVHLYPRYERAELQRATQQSR